MSPEPSAVYIARMAADGSTAFEGAVRPEAPPEASRMRESQPAPLPAQEAELGFDASMHAARFA
ncbi:MAG TPA: hypothetical protein VFX84_00165 [Candidatus Saccharimonadales bacterium]|nr:hypothetical protein [Candidatus Saccharimonadales bacterium]